MKLLDGNELWVQIYRLQHKRRWKNRTNIAFRECLDVIQFFPKVDAEPVKHGHWIKLDYNTFHCKLCGTTFMLIQGISNMNYCPNCGAKMDEERK